MGVDVRIGVRVLASTGLPSLEGIMGYRYCGCCWFCNEIKGGKGDEYTISGIKKPTKGYSLALSTNALVTGGVCIFAIIT